MDLVVMTTFWGEALGFCFQWINRPEFGFFYLRSKTVQSLLLYMFPNYNTRKSLMLPVEAIICPHCKMLVMKPERTNENHYCPFCLKLIADGKDSKAVLSKV
jgi:hypothetical protein